jgi:GTP-binding protein Era
VEELKKIYRERAPESLFIDTVAKERFNIDLLLEEIIKRLPEGPAYYSTEEITDKDVIFQIKEIIREKVLRNLRDEVPHATAIYMEDINWESNPLHIKANIIVEKQGQKGIVIGKDGQRIKKIGQQARTDIEKLLNKHIFLELFVRVQEGWRDDEKSLETYGYKYKK